jgi:hypothetical protein
MPTMILNLILISPKLNYPMDRNNKMPLLLGIIVVYQIIAYLVSFFAFAAGIVTTLKDPLSNDIRGVFLVIFLCILVGYMVYVNVCLLINKGNIIRFLVITMWFNFFQIFYLSLMGLKYYLYLGTMLVPFFLYNGSMIIGFHFELFTTKMNLSYSKSSEITIGLDLIPLIICLVLDRIQKNKSTEFLLGQI